jgi:hypothetical protein
VLICLFFAGSGLGYVWQRGTIDNLGHQISMRERTLARIRAENGALRQQLAYMSSVDYLKMRVKDWNLGLADPHPSQIVRLVEPGAVRTEVFERTEPQYAARSTMPSAMVR